MKLKLTPNFVATGICNVLSDPAASPLELESANKDFIALCEAWEELTGERSLWPMMREHLRSNNETQRSVARAHFERMCQDVADQQGGYL